MKRFSIFVVIVLSLLANIGFARDRSIYVLIVSNNKSLTKGLPDLQYADDDGARYYEFFKNFTENVALFTTFDSNSAPLFKHLQGVVAAPTRKNVLAKVSEFFAQIAKENRPGLKTEFFFIYSGHGGVKNAEGYITFLDGKFTAGEFERHILKQTPAQITHLIIDACDSYFMIRSKGPGGRRVKARMSLVGENFRKKYPKVGVFLSTSKEAETFEWSRYQSGIFSHQFFSGLSGAADVNNDKKITYSELRAFINTANYHLLNKEYKPSVYSISPMADEDYPVISLAEVKQERFLVMDREVKGRYYIEDFRGLRYVDFNKSDEQPIAIALIPAKGFFVRDLTGQVEYLLSAETSGQIAFKNLKGTRFTATPKGAAQLQFNELFSMPFGLSAYVQYMNSYYEEKYIQKKKDESDLTSSNFAAKVNFGAQVFVDGRIRDKYYYPTVIYGAAFHFKHLIWDAFSIRLDISGSRSSGEFYKQQTYNSYKLDQVGFGVTFLYTYMIRRFFLYLGPRIGGIYLNRQISEAGKPANDEGPVVRDVYGLVLGVGYFFSKYLELSLETAFSYFALPFKDDQGPAIYSNIFLNLGFHF